MPRILVFQHVAAEPLGTLDPLIRRRGHRIRFKNFERHPDAQLNVDRYRGLVVLGGPMNVEDHPQRPHLANEMRAIERMLEQGKPVLGICLGAQLLAHVLGARVSRNPVPEIGWYPLALLVTRKQESTRPSNTPCTNTKFGAPARPRRVRDPGVLLEDGRANTEARIIASHPQQLLIRKRF